MEFSNAPSDGYCEKSVRRAIDLIGKKWSMSILWELLHQERRYSELQHRIPGISQKVLSSQLRQLVAAGILERDVVATTPPQVTYRITPEGESLKEALVALNAWAIQHSPTSARVEIGGRDLRDPNK